MAVRSRSGTDGTSIALGKQTAYGTPVKARANMIPVLFPVSAITLDEDADIEESNLITALGSAPPVDIGQLYATGGFTTRILPEYFYHILEGILNPSPVASVELADSVFTVTAGVPSDVSYPGHGSPLEDVGYPARVKISGGGTRTNAKVIVEGLRKAGRDHAPGDNRLSTFYQKETVEAPDTGDFYSKYYAKITKITFTGFASTPTFAWNPNTWKSTVQFQATDPQHPGFTGLVLKGGIPSRVADWLMGEMAISAGTGGIDVTTTGVGTRYDEFRTISDAANFDAPKYALETADTGYYANPSIRSFPGWAGALLFGDEVVKYTSIDFSINRNYENDPGIDGVRFKYGVSAQDNRVLTFSPTSYLRAGDAADADTFLHFQELFRNEAREKLTMRNLSYDQDGAQSQMDWVCADSQIAQSPRSEVSGGGPIDRPLVFRALPAASGGIPELVVTMYTRTQLYTS